jgi:hypothetical protein
MKMKYVKEFLTFPDIMVMSLLFLISLSFSFRYFNTWSGWGIAILGMLTYVIAEYMTHRFLFHIKTPKNPFFLKLIKRLHYDHHTNPNELHLLFLPLWYSLPNMIIILVIVYAITRDAALTNQYMAGLIFFFLYYELRHYTAHRPIKPLFFWGRWMKRVHLWHHFKNENFWYGVTNPAIDVMMGTFKDQKDVEKSETARNLEARGLDQLEVK